LNIRSLTGRPCGCGAETCKRGAMTASPVANQRICEISRESAKARSCVAIFPAVAHSDMRAHISFASEQVI
jgi:hypothetical protein